MQRQHVQSQKAIFSCTVHGAVICGKVVNGKSNDSNQVLAVTVQNPWYDDRIYRRCTQIKSVAA